MRPGRLLTVALLALSLTATGGLPASIAAGAGPKGTCSGTWSKHSKRTVRWVKRHGKRKRQVRWHHWWTCTPAPVLPDPDPPVVVPPTDPDPPAPSRLGIESKEWSYVLSRSHVTAGDLIVELNNSGGDPHNLNVAAGDEAAHGPPLQTIEAVAPAGQGTARFDITPGTYYLYCSLPTHEAQGMHATLVVDPSP